jgi:hypothetical protein
MPEIDDDDLIDDAGSPALKQLRDALKRQEKRSKELEAALAASQAQADRAAQLEREAVFLKAGVPSDGVGTYFLKGYDGDMTVEAVKAAWGELQPKTTEPNGALPHDQIAPEQRQALRDEAARADHMAAASQGAFDPQREAAYDAEFAAAVPQGPAAMTAVLAKYGKLVDQG